MFGLSIWGIVSVILSATAIIAGVLFGVVFTGRPSHGSCTGKGRDWGYYRNINKSEENK